MNPLIAVLVALGVGASRAAAEGPWEVRGEFQQLKSGVPEAVVLRLPDGRVVELPLDALSETSQAAARQAAADIHASDEGIADNRDAVIVRGPFGKPVRVAVPEAIVDVETDAIHCRTAADAADVYRLFLARHNLDAARRAAAEARLREWTAQADAEVVRLGDRWVSAEDARRAAAEAADMVDHAITLMRDGNAELAEDELRKASRADPENGRASFIAGLTYAVVAKNPAKAAEYLAEAVSRDPTNAAALTDLAVVEVLTRRYANVARHFRDAIDNAADPRPVCDNVAWAVKFAGAAQSNPALARNRMPVKNVEDLNGLYRRITQDLGVKPPDAVTAPRFVGPSGSPCAAVTLVDIAKEFAAAGAAPVKTRRSLGFVVAANHVVCPRSVLISADGTRLHQVAVEMPAKRGHMMAATVIAAPEDTDVALLKCEGLQTEPVPLATSMPSLPDITAVGRSGESWLESKFAGATGKVLTPALQVQARGRFVHTVPVPRDLGGGPIVDAAGLVIGMVAPAPRAEASGNAAGFGIPVERIRAVVAEHLPEDASDATGSRPERPSSQDGCIEGTVVVIASTGRMATSVHDPSGSR